MPGPVQSSYIASALGLSIVPSARPAASGALAQTSVREGVEVPIAEDHPMAKLYADFLQMHAPRQPGDNVDAPNTHSMPGNGSATRSRPASNLSAQATSARAPGAESMSDSRTPVVNNRTRVTAGSQEEEAALETVRIGANAGGSGECGDCSCDCSCCDCCCCFGS